MIKKLDCLRQQIKSQREKIKSLIVLNFISLCLCAFVPLFLSISIVNAEIFIWQDKDGNKNFVDDYSKVPSEYKDKIIIQQMKEDSEGADNAEPGNSVVTDITEEIPSDTIPDTSNINDKSSEEHNIEIVNIKPEPDKKGNISFTGEIRNSGIVVVSHLIIDINLNIGKSKSSSIIVNPIDTKDNILRPGEMAPFFIETSFPFSEVNSFTYSVRWKKY